MLVVRSAFFQITTERDPPNQPRIQSTDGGIDLRLCAEMKPKVSTLVERLYNFKTSRAPESIRLNVELAKVLLRDMNFIYPVRHIPAAPQLIGY